MSSPTSGEPVGPRKSGCASFGMLLGAFVLLLLGCVIGIGIGYFLPWGHHGGGAGGTVMGNSPDAAFKPGKIFYDLPADIPVYADAKLVKKDRTQTTTFLEYATKGTYSELVAFYRKGFPDNGWNMVSDAEDAEITAIKINKPKRMIEMSIRDYKPDVHVHIVYSHEATVQ